MEEDKNKLVSVDCDIEEYLDQYLIRKHKDPRSNLKVPAKTAPIISGATLHQCAPLLLRDLKNFSVVDTENTHKNTFKTMVGSEEVYFISCISCVYVVAGCRDTEFFHTFHVDDGSAQMDLNIFRKTKEIREIAKMQFEINELSNRPLVADNKEMFSALRRLLCKASEQLNGSTIKCGSQILIYGIPRLYNGEINFVAYSFCEETYGSSTMELAFKDYLMDWYKNIVYKPEENILEQEEIL